MNPSVGSQRLTTALARDHGISQTIGYASSKDLITWSEQSDLAVMKDEPAVKNCWAPEIVYDVEQKGFIIFWASTTGFAERHKTWHRLPGEGRDIETPPRQRQ